MRIARPAPDLSTFEIERGAGPAIRARRGAGAGRACGVCASELETVDGRRRTPTYPLYLGHEVSGVVAEVGAEVVERSRWVTRSASGSPATASPSTSPSRPTTAGRRGDGPAGHGRSPSRWRARPTRWSRPTSGSATTCVVIGAGFMGNLVQQLVGAARRTPGHRRRHATRRARAGRGAGGDAGRSTSTTESLADVVSELTDGRGADVTLRVHRHPGGAGLGRRRDPDERQDRAGGLPPGRRRGRSRWATGTGWPSTSSTRTSARSPTIMRGMTIGMRLLRAGASSTRSLSSRTGSSSPTSATAFDTAIAKPDGFVKATVVIDRAGG